MAGLMLVAMGAFRLGSFIKFIPYPVTTGFTTGIATVIATLQLKDIFGIRVAAMPDHYVEKRRRPVASACHRRLARGRRRGWDLRPARGTPASHEAHSLAARRDRARVGLRALAHRFFPSFGVATIGTRFHTTVHGVDIPGIPRMMPAPALPWAPGGLTFGHVRELFPSAFAIAMLGAIESLLSAVIADGVTRTKHDPNAELVGLGIGNLVAPFFGGIAATGALARTATNIRAGARSPIAAATHALLVLLAILVLAPLVAYVPMASLAALLLLVAWNMSELRTSSARSKIAPRSDVARARHLLLAHRVRRHGRRYLGGLRPRGDPLHAPDVGDHRSEALRWTTPREQRIGSTCRQA